MGSGLTNGGMLEASRVIRAFSANHVVKLTGLSHRQLSYWDRTEFFRPYYAEDNRRSPYSRVYSFRDVVGLRTIAILRKLHKIPLQQLRHIARDLSQYKDAPWSDLILYVLGKEVYFREPETGSIRGVRSGQYTHLPLRSIIQDVAAEAEKLKHRTSDQIGRIERNRYIVHRAWVIAGTRIPTKAISNFSEAGYSVDGILSEYPLLTKPDIAAALAHEKAQAKRA